MRMEKWLHNSICLTRNILLSSWFNSLWSSDTLWWQRFGVNLGLGNGLLPVDKPLLTTLIGLGTIHLGAISLEVLYISIYKTNLNITFLKLLPYLPGANELMELSQGSWKHDITAPGCTSFVSSENLTLESLLLTWFNFPAWISNHLPSKVWDEITYPLRNFNGATIDIWEWISNFIPDFIIDVITYPCWD